MTFYREQSLNSGENSLFQNSNLNETQLSHVTRESGEKDYKELESLINKTVREDKGNSSILSNSKIVDKSNSMISNDEIWNGSQPLDDSKNFIKNYKDIDEKKKMSIFRKGKKSKKLSKRPNHLTINTQIQSPILSPNKQTEEDEGDYNEDIEESVTPQKNEQVNQLSKSETKNINLSNLNESTASTLHTLNTNTTPNLCANSSNYNYPNSYEIDYRLKYYTSPDELYAYRGGYGYNNFSFPGQSQPMFPTIPMHYMIPASQEASLNKETEAEVNPNSETAYFNDGSKSKSREKDRVNYITKENQKFIQTVNDSGDSKINTAKNSGKKEGTKEKARDSLGSNNTNDNPVSTKASTESTETAADLNANFVNGRKFITPTHQNVNINRPYNFSQVQMELDFAAANMPTPNVQMNKFNLPPTQGGMLTRSAMLTPNATLFSPSGSFNNMKSLSFCSNNSMVNNNIIGLKSTNAAKYAAMGSMNNMTTISPMGMDTRSRPINTYGEGKYTHRSEENLDYKINLENIIIGKDKRTTLMLRNIPNKYTLQNLVDEINPSFWGKYDYVNLPIDYERKLNLGYAFINFIDPMHIVMFYETYFNKKWSKYRSDKKIDLNYAEKQGKKDMTCKDENTYFAAEDKKINFKKISAKLELPMKYYDFFKKIYPNSVCIVENKNGVVGEKTFHVKSVGKRS